MFNNFSLRLAEPLFRSANIFSDIDDMYFNGKNFINELDDRYEYTFNVGDAGIEDINVDVEDEEYLTVSYSYKTDTSSFSSSYTEKVPDNLDTTTIKAKLSENKLVVTIMKKKEGWQD